ncbi:MAG: chemotaxis protein CheW [Byssovorax sp.]
MANLARRAGSPAGLRRARPHDRGPRTEYLAFVLAGDVYAAPVSFVREILKPPPLTPVPRAPHAIMGIVSVRGQLVTVVDLRRRLRLAEPVPTRRARILLADASGGETLGLFVDEVLQVYRLSESEKEPAAAALGGDVAPYIEGIARPSLGSGLAAGGRRSVEGRTDDESQISVVILLDLRAVLGFS